MRTLTMILSETATGGEEIELKTRLLVPQAMLALDGDMTEAVLCNAYQQLSSELKKMVLEARAKIGVTQ
jgi:hypothetical protein